MSDPRAECDELLNAIMPFAESHLTKHGEFHPFGMAMDVDGKIGVVAVYDQEFPDPRDLIRMIKNVFVEGARGGKYKATALAYNVNVTLPDTGNESDAIAVHLDHRDSYSVEVMFPYSLEGNELTINAPFAQSGDAEIFPA